MEYQIMGREVYLRIDRGEQVYGSIRMICEKLGITAGHFPGIGACDSATLSTYLPENREFTHHTLTGLLEMVSLMGNVSDDGEGKAFLHSHAVFSQLNKEGGIDVLAGHLEEATIRYTGEIILTPAEGKIGRKPDTRTEIDIWDLA